MKKELDALQKNNTWDLVLRRPEHNVLGCKWVYRLKHDENGTITKHKARLVANGMHQIDGVDVQETFAPVIKPSTIRLVLFIVVSNGWKLRQLDVSNAFLHGHLQENVFMSQPPGFRDEIYPDYICHLKKSLYGLKQSPRAWFKRLRDFLLEVSFKEGLSDSSLFIYIDDIIVPSSSEPNIDLIVARLADEFSIKDLGSLIFFLGIHVSRLEEGLFLSQQ